jgi:hypothetical protein
MPHKWTKPRTLSFTKRVTLTLSLAFLALIWALAQVSSLRADVVVQVSSVSSPEAAKAESERLLNLGVPSFQRTELAPGLGQVHRVYLGPFASKDEATAAANALKAQGTVKDYIIRDESETQPRQAEQMLPQAPLDAAPGGVLPGTEAQAPYPGVDNPAVPLPAPPQDLGVPTLEAPPSYQPPAAAAVDAPGGAYTPPPMVGPGGERWNPQSVPLSGASQAGSPIPGSDTQWPPQSNDTQWPPQSNVTQEPPQNPDTQWPPPGYQNPQGQITPPTGVIKPGETVYFDEKGEMIQGDAAQPR